VCWENEPRYSVEFARSDARVLDNTTKLAILRDLPDLQLESSYLQNIRYFEGLRPEIRQIFQFNESVDLAVDRYYEELFKLV
jgi:hypothetical protein